tara:strand:- start:2921 stop:3265 length:345 start_codon:yes stop_codon:yes gene_type:complete
MKIQTATELIKKQALKNRLSEFDSILSVIEMASGVSRDDMRYDIEVWTGSVCLRINVDEWYFDIDGLSFEDWCRQNCEGDFNTDKWYRIDSLNGTPCSNSDFDVIRKLENKENK